MLIQNITTEFKDSNGTLRVVWDMYYADDDREVYKIRKVIFHTEYFPKQLIKQPCTDALRDRLLSWAAPQDIETLKAKLAF